MVAKELKDTEDKLACIKDLPNSNDKEATLLRRELLKTTRGKKMKYKSQNHRLFLQSNCSDVKPGSPLALLREASLQCHYFLSSDDR